MKLFGISLICAAAFIAATTIVKKRGDYLRTLRALDRMLELMEGELSSRRSPLPALVESLIRTSEGKAKAFLIALFGKLDALGEKRLAEIWEDSQQQLGLRGEEREAFLQLGLVLGQIDLDKQLEAIRHCREQLQRSAETLGRNLSQNCRTCFAVALLSAAMLCIVLL